MCVHSQETLSEFPHICSNNDESNSLGPVLEKNPGFCGIELFLHSEEFLFAVVDKLVYSAHVEIHAQAIECFEGEFIL